MSSWNIEPSVQSLHTINPIRNIVDKIKRPQNHPLPIIDLALGDPSVFGNLEPHPTTIDAVKNALSIPRNQGYTNSLGVPAAREAIATFMRRDKVDYADNDIIIASGASQAILLVIQLLANPGDCLLIPTPGFSLYETICGHLGVEALEYKLDAERSWEMDLTHIETLIADATTAGKKVKGVLINNPGNPTGSNYSLAHLQEFHKLCLKHCLPVIADEIYAYMLFNQEKFTPFASISQDVPVFTISGLAKQFLVPGWRIGWIAICDRANRLAKARPHLTSLTQVVLGSCTLVQHAIPAILKGINEEHYTHVNTVLQKQATIITEKLSTIKGLKCIQPQGAMYLMVHINVEQFSDEITNDQTFCQLLLNEENIMLLPGSCFKAFNFIRIVFCAPEEKMLEFGNRIERFCAKHSKQ